MSYTPFSETTEYIELNRQFIRKVIPYTQETNVIVDLACGTGMLTELFLEELQHSKIDQVSKATDQVICTNPNIIGIDISQSSLKLAQELFATLERCMSPNIMDWARHELCNHTRMLCVEALGEDLPIATASVDLLLLGNAIHCFTNKDTLLQEIYRVLRSPSVFVFNSTFYAGCMVTGTEDFYGEWVKQALRYAKQWDEEAKARGKNEVSPKRKRGQRAFSNRWLTPSEYVERLKNHGFDVVSVEERRFEMTREHFAGVAAYTGTWEAELAAVLLSSYPIKLACDALECAVAPAFQISGVESVPRSWLEIISIKRNNNP